MNYLEKYFNPDFAKEIYTSLYTYKLIARFIIIGIFSIIFELIIRNILIDYNVNSSFANTISIFFSVLFAFYLNFKFNFKLNKNYFFSSLIIFFLISIFSWFLQYLLKTNLNFFDSYELSRIFYSGICFIFFYFLHFNISFKEKFKLGIAIYANDHEKIDQIHSKVKQFPDFIHVDIVDSSFLNDFAEIRSYRIETIKAFWPKKKIHVHIMSKYPSQWIEKIKFYADRVYVHTKIDEDILSIKKKYENILELCPVIQPDIDLKNYENILLNFQRLLILCISKPGKSGQRFNKDTFNLLDEIKLNKKLKNLKICIDGGINNEILQKVDVQEAVSASYVLNSKNPVNAILDLKYF